MNRLDGKVVLISGGARGIGAETARLMIAAGARIVLGDVLDEAGRATAQRLADAGGEALYIHLDVTGEADWKAAVAATLAHFGRLDILVNNAGIFLGKSIEEATLADWQRLCAVNLTGVFLGTRLALPALIDSGAKSAHGSAIINLSSVAGLVGSANDPLYSLSKGGVALFTKSAALEFARKGYKIRVNSVHPGTTRTDMNDVVLAARAHHLGHNDLEAVRRQALERIPLGHMASAEDIARGIVFLASDDAAFMTGAGLVVDGGITAQ